MNQSKTKSFMPEAVSQIKFSCNGGFEHDFTNEISAYCQNGCGMHEDQFVIKMLNAENSALNEQLAATKAECEKLKQLFAVQLDVMEQHAALVAENAQLKSNYDYEYKKSIDYFNKGLQLESENADFRAALEEIEMAERISHKDTGLAICSGIARAVLSKHDKKETK